MLTNQVKYLVGSHREGVDHTASDPSYLQLDNVKKLGKIKAIALHCGRQGSDGGGSGESGDVDEHLPF